MQSKKYIVAIAGAGDVAKLVVEEMLRDGNFYIVVMSRAERAWFQRPGVDFRVAPGYDPEVVTKILDDTQATILLSYINDNSEFFNDAHVKIIEACKKSKHCKRFIPSEYGGDIETFPNLPRFFVPTHIPIRDMLKKQDELEYTFFNCGYFMDYFVPSNKTNLKPLGPIWNLDMTTWKATIPGTGNEPVGFTAARDVAKAVLELCKAEQWDEYIYVLGERTTWNSIIELLEKFHSRKFQKTHVNSAQVQRTILERKHDRNPQPLWKAYMDEWIMSGASACPEDKVEAFKTKYFAAVKFRTIQDVLEDEKKTNVGDSI